MAKNQSNNGANVEIEYNELSVHLLMKKVIAILHT